MVSLRSAKPAHAWRFRELRATAFPSATTTAGYVGLNGKISELNAALVGSRCRASTMPSAVVADRSNVSGMFAESTCSTQPRPATATLTRISRLLRFARRSTPSGNPTRSRRRANQTLHLPVHQMDAYRPYRDSRLPVTDDVYERILCLPFSTT